MKKYHYFSREIHIGFLCSLFFTILSFLTNAQTEFITTWTTTSPTEMITIPTFGGGYDYDIDWGDGTVDTTQTGNASHTYATADTFTVTISGAFPRIYINNNADKHKILSIENWGDGAWTSMQQSFYGCSNLVLNALDTPDLSNVTNMSFMFYACSSLNADLSGWDVSNVSNMNNLFLNASSFNGNISNWDVSNVTGFASMFRGTPFAGDISGWDVSSATSLYAMFWDASSFNGDISSWDTDSVTSMDFMFKNTAAFNQDLSLWDVSSVTGMYGMFEQATNFNSDISSWDVSSATQMGHMFNGASAFDQSLATWDVDSVTSMNNMLNSSGLSRVNYDKTLKGWASQTVQTAINLGAVSLKYCDQKSRDILTNAPNNWTINGDMQETNCPITEFITTWATTTPTEMITIPTFGGGYDYDIDWGDGTVDTTQTGNASHTYATADTFTVTISGTFPRIYFNNSGDKNKILSVESWGTGVWVSMQKAFLGCVNLRINATDPPDLSNVTDMTSMFHSATSMNDDLSNWDVSNVTDMTALFFGALSFNQPLNNWDVSSVMVMTDMFRLTPFNQPLDNWDVSNVTSMVRMFQNSGFNEALDGWNLDTLTTAFGMFESTTAFNQPLNGWQGMSNLIDIRRMFYGATAFNQPIDAWDVSSVTNLQEVFKNATAFNQSLSAWDVSIVAIMRSTFEGATSFNGAVNSWNTSNVINMHKMFHNAPAFNQPLDSFDVSGVTDMVSMFHLATSFNQPLNTWNLASVTNMFAFMLQAYAFDQNIASWNMPVANQLGRMLESTNLSIANYDSLLIGWSDNTFLPNQTIGVNGLGYCVGGPARDSIIANLNWTFIADGGEQVPPEAACENVFAVLYLDGAGQATLNENALAYGQSTDNCGPAIETSPETMFSCGDVGWQSVIMTATDGFGNTDTAGCSVLVLDTLAPSLTCPADITVNADPGSCAATGVVLGNATATDNCATITPTLPNGTTPTYTFFVGERGGNFSTLLPDGTRQVLANVPHADGVIAAGPTSILVSRFNPAGANLVEVNLITGDQTDRATLGGLIQGMSFNDDGDLLIVNEGLQKLQLIDTSTWVATDFITGLNRPIDVVVETDTTLLISEYNFGEIKRYNLNSTILSTLSTGHGFPTDILLEGDSILVAENGGDVSSVNRNTGVRSVLISGLGTTPSAHGLARGSDGDLYITVWSGGTVQRWSNGVLSTFASGLAFPVFLIAGPGELFQLGDNDVVWSADDGNGNVTTCIQRVTVLGSGCDNTAEVLDFDGVDDFVDLGVFTPHGESGFTQEAWVFAESFGPNDYSNSVLIQEGGSGTTSTILRVGQNGANNVRASYHHSGGMLYDLDGSITANAWHHLAMTWDGTTFSLYVDGVLSQSIPAVNPPDASNVPVLIGDSHGASGRFFDGKIDEVRIWDYARSQAEIQNHMDNALHGTESGLIAYYNFDQGNAFLANPMETTLIDQTGNHNGTLTNFGLATGANSNWVEPGPYLDVPASTGFVTRWAVLDTNDLTVTIPTTGYGYEYSINWGDGIIETGLTGQATHVYPHADTFTISIDGDFPRLYMKNSPHRPRLVSIEQWGDIEWASMDAAFYGCYYMVNNATDAPDLSNVTSTVQMFRSCSSFTGDLNSWDMSNVMHLYEMFHSSGFSGDVSAWNTSSFTSIGNLFQYSQFNGDISNWNVSNVQDMGGTFSHCPFNQPLDNWERTSPDTSTLGNCLYMGHLFSGNGSFNQNINNWDVSNVNGMQAMFYRAHAYNQPLNNWEVGTVNAMSLMFNEASAFNQPLDQWDVSAVTDMSRMFAAAPLFNQDLSTWNTPSLTKLTAFAIDATAFDQSLGNFDVSKLTDGFAAFRSCGMSTANYDATLIGWGAQTVRTGVFIGAGYMQYCAGEAARQQLIDDYGWIFSGDIRDAACVTGPPAEALCFDGVDDNVTLPTLTGINQHFTYQTSIYSDSTTIMPDFYGFLFHLNNGSTRPIDLYINNGDDGPVVVFGIEGDDMYEAVTTTDSLVPGQWNHIAVVLDGVNFTSTLYINGSQEGQISTTNNLFTGLGTLTNNTLGSHPDFPGENWNGVMDEVSIWNVALTQAEIQSQIGADLTGLENGLQYYYKFNQGNAFSNNAGVNSLDDEFGTSHGTLNNFTLDGNCSNWVFPGDTFNIVNPASNPFITTWHTAVPNDSIFIPAFGTGHNYTVDWGDGTIDADITESKWHVYADTGIHVVKISADTLQINFGPNSSLRWRIALANREKLRSIEQWGDIVWQSMENAFWDCKYMKYNALDAPDLSNVTSMAGMFVGTSFDGNLNGWDVSNVTLMSSLFVYSAFSGSVNAWNTSAVTDMSWMFFGSNSNIDISNWDVSNVSDMSGMFRDAEAFNQDIGSWDVSKVSNMSDMFRDAEAFNQDIGSWDVSNVLNMLSMFSNAKTFNQDIGSWDVSNISDMSSMFYRAEAFNQDIGNWNVSNVRYMSDMFRDAEAFNQDIGSWDVSNVTYLKAMFRDAEAFNQDIGSWDLSNVGGRYGLRYVLDNSGMSMENYDQTLIGWAGQVNTPTYVRIGVRNLQYCASQLARDYLINTKRWRFSGDALADDCPTACNCNPNISPLIPNTAGGMHSAAIKCDDGTFTHYCDNLGRLLLSIDSETAKTIPIDSVNIKIVPGTRYYEQDCAASADGSEQGTCFITNQDGAVVLCRSWDVNSSETDAKIRYYFDDDDLAIINQAHYDLGLNPPTDLEQLWFYKVINSNGHQKPQDLASGDVELITNNRTDTSTLTNWVLDTTAIGSYSAEYAVASFSGGGGGGGEKGTSPACPYIEAVITGDTILAAAGSAMLSAQITGGVGPYTIRLSDSTTVSSYNSSDPIAVNATETKTFEIDVIIDANGCPLVVTQGSATVFVSAGDDQVSPIVRCQDVTISLDQNGNGEITAGDVTLVAFDDVEMGNLSIDQSTFDCSDGGLAFVTLLGSDVSGNLSTCVAEVTILDTFQVCCPNVRNVAVTPTDTKLYKAEQQVISDAAIKIGNGNTNIQFRAGDNIELNAGFEVELGATFETEIGPCD